MRAHRGQGTSGIVGLLLALIPVSIFLLPSHVGDMYAEAGKTKPITGYAGLWALIPIVGSIVWLFKVQGRLNEFWAAASAEATAPVGAGARRRARLGVNNRVRQHADAVDLDGDLVACLEQYGRIAEHADAGWRAREDEVARLEGDRLADERDDLGDAEHHVRRRRVLHHLAVQDGADAERLRVGDLGSGDEGRPHRAERVERLAARPLAVSMLEIARVTSLAQM